MRALAAGALLLALAPVACRTQAPERGLYQWSDENGNVRYTTSPTEAPREARATLVRVERGQTAEANAARLPGARTEPRDEPSAAEWLRGDERDAGEAASEAEVREQASVPTTPEEIAALDAQIHALEQEITETEVGLAERIGAPAAEGEPQDDAAVREATERLPRLQAELEELRTRRGLVTPADGR